MAEEKKIHLIWEKTNCLDFMKKKYESSYLIVIADPSPDMGEKCTNRMIISRKTRETTE